jgi:hypothetical protein
MPAPARRAVTGLLAAGALLTSLTACQPAGQVTAAQSGTRHQPAAAPASPPPPSPPGPGGDGPAPATGAAVAAATVAVTAASHLAPARGFGDGVVYDAWITSVTPGRPGHVTMEMAWHYTGGAAVGYARAHGLAAPLDDHIDVGRGFSATVAVAPSAQASVNPDGSGPQQLTPAGFVAWAGQHRAVKTGGEFGGPIYTVTFAGDVLVSASQIFEP